MVQNGNSKFAYQVGKVLFKVYILLKEIFQIVLLNLR